MHLSLPQTAPAAIDAPPESWAGRETGRAIVYASPEAEREAAQIVLRGSIEGLRPDESIGAVGSTTGLALTVERDRIEVRPAER